MKGERIGGKRYVDVWGFRGYITARINPYRQPFKEEVKWKKQEHLRHLADLRAQGLFVTTDPCLIPDNGRAARGRELTAYFATPEAKMKRMKNQVNERLKKNRAMKKSLLARFGTIKKVIDYLLQQSDVAQHAGG